MKTENDNSTKNNSTPIAKKPKKMPVWAKVLVIIAGVFVSLIVVAIIFAATKLPGVANDSRENAEAFVANVKRGDYDRIYDSMIDEAKEQQSKERLAELAGVLKIDESCADSMDLKGVESGSGGSFATYAGKITCDNVEYSIVLVMQKQGDVYKVRSFQFS